MEGGRLLGKQVKEDTRDRDKVDGTKEAGDGSSAQQTGSIPAGSAQSSTNSSVSSSRSGADGNSSVGSAANLSNKESRKPFHLVSWGTIGEPVASLWPLDYLLGQKEKKN